MKRVVVIIGHNRKAQGAVAYNGQSEYVFNTIVAKRMYEYCKANYPDIDMHVIDRDTGDISGAASKLKTLLPVNVSLELHLNDASGDPRGCEILVYKGDNHYKDAVILADKITDWISEEYKIKERHVIEVDSYKADGVKSLADKERGAWNLKAMDQAGANVSLLIEPCFCRLRTRESEAIMENPEKYGEFLVDCFAKYWKFSKKENN